MIFGVYAIRDLKSGSIPRFKFIHPFSPFQKQQKLQVKTQEVVHKT
jgi:hypothetical protein